MRKEILKNIDDLNLTIQLFDELLCATKKYPIIKKFFWNVKRLFITNKTLTF
jgi:hypothetical protein